MDQRDYENLAAAIVVLILLSCSVWLLSAMKRHGQVEDCLLARRRNCDALLER